VSALRRDLLGLLTCPSCHGDLEVEETAGNYLRVTTGVIRCPGCGREYPVLEGIPDFRGGGPLEPFQEPEWATTALSQDGRDRVYDAYWIALPEEVRRHGPRMIRDLAKLAVPKGGGAILDVATGAGTLIEEVLKHVDRATLVVGTDYSRSVTRSTRAHLLRLGRYDQVSLVVCDVRRLPFKDDVFSSACSFAGYQNIQQRPELAVAETFRTMKNGAPVAFGATVIRENSRTAAHLSRQGLERFYVTKLIRETFAGAGFDQIHFKTYLSGTWPGNPYDPLPLSGDWYGHGIITAQKPKPEPEAQAKRPARTVRPRAVRPRPVVRLVRRRNKPSR
jgi:ubiquinone/menaquinone biosynthesis C-methylase UbiE/uncharacterized protein YbaR (Trm112 family)